MFKGHLMNGCNLLSFQANRVDFVQLMINARETSLKTEQMEVNLDHDDDTTMDKKKTSSQTKGMTLEVYYNVPDNKQTCL